MEHNILAETKQESRLPEYCDPGFKPHWEDDLEINSYHSDKSAISSSGLKMLMSETPAHFRHKWMNPDAVDEEKEAFRFGALCHVALLEPKKFLERYVIEPVFEGPTKDGRMSTQSAAAKQAKKEWYEALDTDSIIVTNEDYERIMGITTTILENPLAKKLLKEGTPERSGWFRDPVTNLKCRIRPDLMNIGLNVYVDFKTTRDASDFEFGKDSERFDYPLQMAFYYDGITQISGKAPDGAVIIAAEKTAPYLCNVITIEPEHINLGRDRYQHALWILDNCLKSGKWPGYQSEAKPLNLPPWAYNKPMPHYNFGEER
jgi:PDDEXK-like domain of unknown function (DUF3799)